MISDCRKCTNHDTSIFRGLEPALAERLAAVASVQQYRHRQIICSEGSSVRAVHCVIEGAVKLSRAGERGENQVLRLLGPGAVIGVRPIMANEDYAARAEAAGDCCLCRVPRASFLELMHDSADLCRNVTSWLARELRISEDLLMVMTQRTVKRRIADLLLRLHGEIIDEEDWLPLPHIRLTRREMAQMVGTTPETFSRVLADFAKRGLIALTRRDLTIVSPSRLHALADPKHPRT